VVLTPGVCASSHVVMLTAQPGTHISHLHGDGGNSASLPEEITKDTVKTIRAGKAGMSGDLSSTPVRVLIAHAGLRVPAGAQPSLRPRFRGGRNRTARLGRKTPRGREGVSRMKCESLERRRLSTLRHCERSEAIQNLSTEGFWIAHMGIWCVKWDGQLFVRLQASSSSRPCGLPDGARRSGQDRPVRAAAKRLGLDVSEHAIRLLWSGVAGGGSSYRWRSQGRAGFGNLVCMPDQTHIRSSRDSDCTNIPLAAGRLERTGPFFVAAFEAMQSIGSSTRIGRG
jgi:hypothetical protein